MSSQQLITKKKNHPKTNERIERSYKTTENETCQDWDPKPYILQTNTCSLTTHSKPWKYSHLSKSKEGKPEIKYPKKDIVSVKRHFYYKHISTIGYFFSRLSTLDLAESSLGKLGLYKGEKTSKSTQLAWSKCGIIFSLMTHYYWLCVVLTPNDPLPRVHL